MPELPNLTQVAAAPEQASGVRIAAPSMSGLRSVAQGLGAIGDEMQQARMRQLEYQTKMDVLQTENDYATFMEKKKLNLDVNNPLGWEESMRAASGEWKETQLASKTISPAARKQLDLRLAQQEGSILRSTMRDAELSQVRMLNTLFKTRQEQYLDSGDYASALNNLDELRADLKLNDAEYEAQKTAILKHQTMSDYKSIALSGNVDYFKEPKSNLTQAQQYTLQRTARAARAQTQRDQIDAANDAIFSGEIKSEQDLLNITPDLNAKAQKGLIDDWRDENKAQKLEQLRTPEAQAMAEGAAIRLIKDYEQKAITENPDGIDEYYLKASKAVQLVLDEDRQKLLQTKLADAAAGKKEELKTIEDFGYDMVSNFAESKFIKPDDDDLEGPALQSYLDDGFLLNEDKLRKVGFSEDQIETIVTAAKTDQTQLEAGESSNLAVAKVRALWKFSSPKSKDLSERDWAIFQAIKNYGTKSTPIADPAEVVRYKRTQQEAMRFYNEGKSLFIGNMRKRVDDIINEFRRTENRNPTLFEIRDRINLDVNFSKSQSMKEDLSAGKKPTL